MLQSDKWELSPTLEEALAMKQREGEEKGRLEGKIEGQLEERRNLAKAMLSEGFAAEQIIKLTKLSAEEVGLLKKGLL
ncbi:hypothetical protein MKY41_16060 [Sporosarcina sp. FSL W7-1349]|uniref:hypothetical protein n=1 Tax=Sporosarcina sp. FSL W7-1349 TaxID=2921561 RepID=UPI0030FAAF88